MTAKLRQDVNGDDVAAFLAAGADAEADDLLFRRGRIGVGGIGFGLSLGVRDEAIGAAETQVGPQLALRVRDFGFIAGLINFVERVEIVGLENSESEFHRRVCKPAPKLFGSDRNERLQRLKPPWMCALTAGLKPRPSSVVICVAGFRLPGSPAKLMGAWRFAC